MVVNVSDRTPDRNTFVEHLLEWHQALIENGSDYIAEVEGQKFVEFMRAEHPAELDEWLTTHAAAFVSKHFAKRDRMARARAIQREPQRSFSEAVQASAEGAGVGVFDKFLVINDDAVRRPIGEMTGVDHKFVARSYKNTGNRSLLLAAFHGAISNKLGKRRTADVFTEEQYLAMREQVLAPPKAPQQLAVAA